MSNDEASTTRAGDVPADRQSSSMDEPVVTVKAALRRGQAVEPVVGYRDPVTRRSVQFNEDVL
jgi:hypothetical protein